MMSSYNDIGISKEIDKDRISHLFRIGIFAALMVLDLLYSIRNSHCFDLKIFGQ